MTLLFFITESFLNCSYCVFPSHSQRSAVELLLLFLLLLLLLVVVVVVVVDTIVEPEEFLDHR